MKTSEDLGELRAALPNLDLVLGYCAEYYQGNAGSDGKGLLSSHWREFAGYMDARVDEESNALHLASRSLGNYKWRGANRWSAPANWALDAACILSHIARLPERRRIARLFAGGRRLCRRIGIAPTRDFFRQVCSMALLEGAVAAHLHAERPRVLMIGDGLGVLSALFRAVFPQASLCLVDIGESLLFQSYYCQRAHPDCRHSGVGDAMDWANADFAYCPAEHLRRLEGVGFDAAVNIASMQEMTGEAIATYFAFLRRNLNAENLFYCCNRTRKVMSGGEVADFFAYPWRSDDRFLVDEFCPWQRYYLSLRRAPLGPRLLGQRRPFVNFYDGETRHRLAVLARA